MALYPCWMEKAEQAIAELTRLGLKPDPASVRRYAKQLLRPGQAWSDDFRDAVGKLVLDSAGSLSITRKAVPRELQGAMTGVVSIDEPAEAERPILPEPISLELDMLVSERKRLSVLESAGLEPTRTLLLTGPPGVGKSMTAKHLASAMEMPLITVELSAVMSSLLGRSGQNLKSAIDYARSSPCVLLVDEFDAIAKRRDDPTDVGELKRLVNVLLLELEQWPSTGLFIAATNHPELLDKAIWRRFERTIRIPLPDLAAREQLIAMHANVHSLDLSRQSMSALAEATDGLSGSDIATIFNASARRQLLSEEKLDAFQEIAIRIVSHIVERDLVDGSNRDEICRLASEFLGWSNREIARLVGLSHVTVGKILRGSPAKGQKGGSRVTR